MLAIFVARNNYGDDLLCRSDDSCFFLNLIGNKNEIAVFVLQLKDTFCVRGIYLNVQSAGNTKKKSSLNKFFN